MRRLAAWVGGSLTAVGLAELAFGVLVKLSFVVMLFAFAAWWAVGLVVVRSEDPYAESPYALDITDRDALIHAEVVDGRPRGPVDGPRIHRLGTLMLLRFEALAVDGTVLSVWRVRALVPAPPAHVWRDSVVAGSPPCPERCQERLRKDGAVRIDQPGNAGVDAEWLLRLPVGQSMTFDRRLATHDIFDAKSIESPTLSDAAKRYFPADVRVTLVEACDAEATVNYISQLERPRRTMGGARWLQIRLCTAAP